MKKNVAMRMGIKELATLLEEEERESKTEARKFKYGDEIVTQVLVAGQIVESWTSKNTQTLNIKLRDPFGDEIAIKSNVWDPDGVETLKQIITKDKNAIVIAILKPHVWEREDDKVQYPVIKKIWMASLDTVAKWKAEVAALRP